MADKTSNDVERDEEDEVLDSDSGDETSRTDKADEEQTVRDTDADTSDIETRLDSIEQMMQRMMGTMNKLSDAQSVLVESGAIIDTADEDPTDDDGISASSVDDILDLRIDD